MYLGVGRTFAVILAAMYMITKLLKNLRYYLSYKLGYNDKINSTQYNIVFVKNNEIKDTLGLIICLKVIL